MIIFDGVGSVFAWLASLYLSSGYVAGGVFLLVTRFSIPEMYTVVMDRDQGSPPSNQLAMSEAALQSVCSRFCVPPVKLRKPLAKSLGRKPMMHMIFGLPCTGKSTLSVYLANQCRRGATINMDYDDAALMDPPYKHIQAAAVAGSESQIDTLNRLVISASEYWGDMFMLSLDAAAVHGYDVIIPMNDLPVTKMLGPFVETWMNRFELYAHFTVASPEYANLCMAHRISSRSRVQLVYTDVDRAIRNRVGSTLNVFLEEYFYMIQVTSHIFFYFAQTREHVPLGKANVRFDRTARQIIVNYKSVKKRAVGKRKRSKRRLRPKKVSRS